MTIIRQFACALTGGLLAISSGAAAQSLGDNPPVEIINNSGEERKICFHKPKRVTLFAIGCVKLKSGENIYWDRKSTFTPFKVKVYQTRKLLDKYLYARDLPLDTGKIIIGSGARFGFSRFKNMIKKFVIRACNTDQAETVWFAYGLDTPYGMLSEGWWSIPQGTCRNIAVTQRAKDKFNIPTSATPRIFYYARTYGDKPRFWRKNDLSRSFCVNESEKFLAQFVGEQGECGAGQKKSLFRWLSSPGQNSAEVIDLTF